MSDLRTVTLAAFLEAAGWKRKNVCASALYDVWVDPLSPHGRPWLAIAALIEEFRRREPKVLAQDGSAPPPTGITFKGNPDEGRFHDGEQVRLVKDGKVSEGPSLFDEEDVPW